MTVPRARGYPACNGDRLCVDVGWHNFAEYGLDPDACAPAVQHARWLILRGLDRDVPPVEEIAEPVAATA